jgi:aminocarboxymuconate-semialdehyde decarboxylase
MMIGDRFFREIGDNAWDPRRRLEECDRTGVSVQVLSTVPVMFSYWAKPTDGLDLSRRLNDHIAGVVRAHPARFAGLGTIPLQDPELAARELERCVRELGLRGVQIGSHIDANSHLPNEPRNLDDRSARSGLADRGRMGGGDFRSSLGHGGQGAHAEILAPWLVGMPAETSLAICSMIFGGVFDRFPRLRVAFAHGGGAFPFTIGRIEHGFNVRPDLVAIDSQINPRSYLARLDERRGRPGALLRRFVSPRCGRTSAPLKLFGVNRIALGSDYPFPLGEAHPGELIESMPDFSPEEKTRLLSGSAREFLALH